MRQLQVDPLDQLLGSIVDLIQKDIFEIGLATDIIVFKAPVVLSHF